MSTQLESPADFIASVGPLGLTWRCRRLADRLTEDARRLYHELGLKMEPNWYALLLLLKRCGALTIGEIASAMRLRHPSVIALAKGVERAGLVTSDRSSTDGRQRIVRLSAAGRKRVGELSPVWFACARALAELIDGTGQDVLGRSEE